ncbi:MAG: serine hydrolase [Planctomycetes bacterium]|nr:serine hydrolase [Planctomycetota bacterium]
MPCSVNAAIMIGSTLLATPMTLCGQADQIELIPEIDRRRHVEAIVQAYHDLRGFNGVVLAAVGDNIVLRRGYGYANVEHGISNTPATRFRLASVTKQFTAAAILLLVEQDLLELDAPVSTYLADLDPKIADRVTLHHLLTHTAGLERAIERLGEKDGGDHFTMDEMITLINNSNLQSEPGERFQYSNVGYILAAAIIESVTGKPYGAAMRELIFDPLGMSDTDHELAQRIVLRRADGMIRFPDGPARSEFEDKSYVTGAGSVYSTLDDLFVWSRAVQKRRVLSEEYRSALVTHHTSGYAYGWFTFSYTCAPGMALPVKGDGVTHDGGCPGFSTCLRWYLDHDITVIVLANMRPFPSSELANKIGNILVGIHQQNPSPAVADELIRIALEEGVEAATSRARDMEAAGREIPTPNEINTLGYRYLAAHRISETIRVQELQVALFPRNANALDSLAEACAVAGQIDRAIMYYSRALEVDPDFQNARQRLGELRASRSKPAH